MYILSHLNDIITYKHVILYSK